VKAFHFNAKHPYVKNYDSDEENEHVLKEKEKKRRGMSEVKFD